MTQPAAVIRAAGSAPTAAPIRTTHQTATPTSPRTIES